MPTIKHRLIALSPANRARRFRDRNRRFRKLNIKQQKLRIIRDVIVHLETARIKAATGRYITVPNKRRKIDPKENIHEILEESRCTVCAIGGMFTSAVLLNNKLKVKDLREGSKLSDLSLASIRSYLSKWFDWFELSQIELAFEIGRFERVRASEFGRRYRSSKARLIAICNNMLENDGRFVFVPGAE